MLFAMFLGCHLAIVVSFFLIARKNNIQLGFYFDSLIIFFTIHRNFTGALYFKGKTIATCRW